ncbi:retron Ec67 family RNA-directed DNA polymerase/endonuclease [Psychrobacter fozii]|uniref:RNA-directed DNA polymerase n=1 Tax=Psychrobacter fozii TaxID=198480 RepID=A0A2V4VG28_9GAMM|nr:retron Ec67 family RNA-directed DNA polymerase/endonuclease [Psychrobacter fozii]PYE41238.1 RNA-directed DNA polymerase [Psychrobacter fozii]
MNDFSKLKALQKTTTLSELAHLLRVQPKTLSYNIYIIDKNKTTTKKYSEFSIPKKSGGTRIILAPNQNLKFIQSQLSKILYSCIDEINKEKGVTGSLSFGYRKKSSIFDNAKVHKKKKFVFNIDLKNYFDSINFGRVRGFFIKNRNFCLDENVATVIAQIACHNNILPQGSPVSPVISNLIGHILDIRLSKIASSCGCSYSRYCDDITFSTNEKVFPKKLAYSNTDKTWHPSKLLISIVSQSGFEINMQKVRMSLFYSQQRVTGLTVNKKVNTTRAYRDLVRALVHSLCTKGDFEFRGDFYKDKISETNKLNSLQGMLNYISRIEYQELRGNRENKRFYPNINKLTKSEITLRDYVLFRYFFNPEKVTIFGEGKTDKSHLKHYLNFRSNIDTSKNPMPESFSDWKNMNFHDFESRIFDVISKSGGTGDIKKLVTEYKKYCNKFCIPEVQNPVIILVDDDDGSADLLMKLEKVKKDKLIKVVRKDFYHIDNNLYLIFLPRINSTDTDIESFYSKEVIDIPRNGLYFEKSNLSNNKRNYSKKVFATEIIPRNQELVDWSKFDQIFEKVQLAIEHFQSKK